MLKDDFTLIIRGNNPTTELGDAWISTVDNRRNKGFTIWHCIAERSISVLRQSSPNTQRIIYSCDVNLPTTRHPKRSIIQLDIQHKLCILSLNCCNYNQNFLKYSSTIQSIQRKNLILC